MSGRVVIKDGDQENVKMEKTEPGGRGGPNRSGLQHMTIIDHYRLDPSPSSTDYRPERNHNYL